jgi:hypothetical protein
LLSELSYQIINQYFLAEPAHWRYDGLWDANANITEDIHWVVKHSEDPETIIHEVIVVIVIKLNYVKQLQDLK